MTRFYRRVLKIRGQDSPNVRLALEQERRGIPVTNEIVVPGILPYADYCKRLATWDEMLVCIGINAEFYEGARVLLYPPLWLNRSAELADELDRGDPQRRRRQARAIGIDPAEGGDRTAMCVVDEYGVIELISELTPNTARITGSAIALIRKYGVDPSMVLFDRGGGGKQHADRLWEDHGLEVRTVAFGETIAVEPKVGRVRVSDRREARDERYSYKNRRAQMYGLLRLLLDPSTPYRFPNAAGFAIPNEFAELRRQLSLIPLTYDGEGRLELPPKHRREVTDPNLPGTKKTLVDIIGCSPDEADALVLAVYGMCEPIVEARVGVAF